VRKYQIWKLKDSYAISDYEESVINFATHKNFSLKYKKHSTIDTETATKPAFITFLAPLITSHGVHPIFNSKGESCEQIVNVPNRIMTSEEILVYLNKYTILPQETPPWEEIIFKLACYSSELTEEYFDRMNVTLPVTKEEINGRSEDDIDVHYFVSAPKIFEGKKGTVFHLPKPNRAHRKWVILEEHYCHKKNAWVNDEEIFKRTLEVIDLIDKKKEIDQDEIERAKKDFLNSKKVEKKEPKGFDWQSLKIHPLAIKIPAASGTDRERLRKDIILHGVHEPVKLYQGMVLDGRTRQELSVEEGIKPPYAPWKGNCTPKEYVESMNLKRRHLTASQLAAYGVENLLEKYEKEAQKRRKVNGKNSQLKEDRELIPSSTKGKSTERLANFLEINPRYISDAKNIKARSPELFKKVFNGEVTITKAKTILKDPPKKRKNCKFENRYKEMLKVITERELSLKDYYTPSILLSKIYMEWNKRNDGKMIKKLEELKTEFPIAFGERHLTLLRM